MPRLTKDEQKALTDAMRGAVPVTGLAGKADAASGVKQGFLAARKLGSASGASPQTTAIKKPNLAEVILPLDSFVEGAPHLRRPFTPAAIKFKVQTATPKENPRAALVVYYIDARLVVERLNLVVPHLWEDDYEVTPKGNLRCRLTVDGLTRQDIGEGAGKALWSDALKRAAVKFGIGVSCYAIPTVLVEGAERVERRDTAKAKSLVLKQDGRAAARKFYENWLEKTGIQAFGEPLDHGDLEESQGDFEAESAPEASNEPQQLALDDEQAERQRAQAEALFGELHQLDPKAMLRATFDNYLVSAQHSHDRLDELVGYMRQRVHRATPIKGEGGRYGS